tara:strand:+ start:7450 stop:9144 length:1695 start_codon:yes stop_codon:yes gene_type:complete
MGQLVPVRELGSIGVVTDIRPASLPIPAFTRAKNVRFTEGKISRSPLFREIELLSVDPRFVFSIPSNSQNTFSSVVIVTKNYSILKYTGSSTLASIAGSSIPSTSNSALVFTAASLADVIYINREDKVPSYMAHGGSTFEALPNFGATDSSNNPIQWRAKAIRSYGDFLIALNMDEGGTQHTSRVRFSTPALSNATPTTWDEGDTTASAGFNDLVQMKTGIVDGLSLENKFIIYSKDQVWLMEFVGGTFIHNFRKIFNNCGVINQNCIVEVEGVHYVFDHDDIYIHDTNTRQSICDQRVKRFIFDGLDTAQTSVCFVHHNVALNEILFCYVSNDDMADYLSTDEYTSSDYERRCNRAAVYNYRSETWSFVDLPNVSSATNGSVDTSETYASIDSTISYSSFGGTYNTQGSGYNLHEMFVGSNLPHTDSTKKITQATLYGLDLSSTGSILSSPISVEGNRSPFIERQGIDLDELSSISGYKVINKVVPQIEVSDANKNFTFSFGSSDFINGTPIYGSSITFDSGNNHKIDTRVSGRYLSYKMTVDDTKDFDFLGFDFDVLTTGRR